MVELENWQASPVTHTPESMSPVCMLEKGFLPFKAQKTTVCTTELNWWRGKWTTAPQLPLSESIRHSLYIKMLNAKRSRKANTHIYAQLWATTSPLQSIGYMRYKFVVFGNNKHVQQWIVTRVWFYFNLATLQLNRSKG